MDWKVVGVDPDHLQLPSHLFIHVYPLTGKGRVVPLGMDSGRPINIHVLSFNLIISQFLLFSDHFSHDFWNTRTATRPRQWLKWTRRCNRRNNEPIMVIHSYQQQLSMLKTVIMVINHYLNRLSTIKIVINNSWAWLRLWLMIVVTPAIIVRR